MRESCFDRDTEQNSWLLCIGSGFYALWENEFVDGDFAYPARAESLTHLEDLFFSPPFCSGSSPAPPLPALGRAENSSSFGTTPDHPISHSLSSMQTRPAGACVLLDGRCIRQPECCMGDETTGYKLTTACRFSNVIGLSSHMHDLLTGPKIGTCISWRSSSSLFPLEIPHEPARSAEPPLQPMFSNLARPLVRVQRQSSDRVQRRRPPAYVPSAAQGAGRGVAWRAPPAEVDVRGAITSNSSRTGEVDSSSKIRHTSRD